MRKEAKRNRALRARGIVPGKRPETDRALAFARIVSFTVSGVSIDGRPLEDGPDNPFSIFRHWDYDVTPAKPDIETTAVPVARALPPGRRRSALRFSIRCSVCRWKGRRAWGYTKPCHKCGGVVHPRGRVNWEAWWCVESRGGDVSPGSRPA